MLPIVSTGTVTRPADTTQYAAGDVVTAGTAAAIQFAGMAPKPNGRAYVTGAVLIDSAKQTTLPVLELRLYDTNFTPADDNAAFAPTDAQEATLVGVIQFNNSSVGNAAAGASGNVIFEGRFIEDRPHPFHCTGGTNTLYGVLVARNAYTPVSAEVFTIRLEGLWVD